MTEENTIPDNPERRKVSVTFGRKLTDGNYGGTEATAWVQGDLDANSSAQDIAVELANLFQACKAAVLDELGVEWHLDDQGIVRETHTPTVSTQHAQAAVQRAFPNTTSEPSAGGGTVRVMNAGKDGVSNDPLPDWLIRDCQKSGITAVWDQRHTATGNQPLFKEAVPRGGTGKGKDGQPKGFWPPR